MNTAAEKQFIEKLEEVKEADREYFRDAFWVSELPEDYLDIKEMSLGYFILSCLPMIYYWAEYQKDGKNIRLTMIFVYIPTLLFLLARFFLEKKAFPLPKFSFFLYLLLWMGCMMGSIFGIRICGSDFGWIAVYTIVGTVITLTLRTIRALENKKKKKLKEVKKRAVVWNEKINAAIDLYYQAKEMEDSGVRPWFACKRADGKYIRTSRSTETDFKTPFTAKNESSGSKSISWYIRNQDFGWRTISSTEAQDLLKKGEIYPFFALGTKEFRPEWEYMLMKHSWDIEITTLYYTKRKVIDDSRQAEFDMYVAFSEAAEFGLRSSPEDYLYDDDPDLARAAKKYQEKKKELRDELAIEYEVPEIIEEKSYKNGDEVGALLIKDQNGKIVGVYSGKTYTSVKFTFEQLKGTLDYEVGLFEEVHGGSQESYMINKFLY